MKKEKLDQLILLMERYCDYTERSSHDVRTKLKKEGINSQDINRIIDHLIESDYVHDLRYAIQYAQGKNKYNKWGKQKIFRALLQKKLKKETIDQALDKIDGDGYRTMLQELFLNKYKALNDKDIYIRKNKAVKYCLDKGYEYELVREIADDSINNAI